MRASRPGGRFDTEFEIASIQSGIKSEVQRTVGQHVDWWIFDPQNSAADPIYDVGASSGGRRWLSPKRVPTVSAIILHGQTIQNERGFYQTDMGRFLFRIDDIAAILPAVVDTPDIHIKDRFVYRGQVFMPSQFYLRGLLTDKYTLLMLDANQVNPEELINDPQFQDYALLGESAPPLTP